MAQGFQFILVWCQIGLRHGGLADLPRLPDQFEKTALARFKIIAPFLDSGVPLARISNESGISLRTLWYWVQSFESEGLSGLPRKTRLDKGGSRTLSAEVKSLIEGLLLKRPAPTVTNVHKLVVDLCLQRGWIAPSYATVYRLARSLPSELKTLAHAGEKCYEQLYEIIIRREAAKANEIWQADHTPMDILVKDDNGLSRRPWLTAVLDDFSRAIAGYYIAFEPPSSVRTALALRQSIWHKSDEKWQICGIPDKLYTDRGSDFMSHHIEQVAADLRIELINTRAYKPRGKGKVERFFDTVNQMFLARLPGYLPPGQSASKAKLNLSELTGQFHDWLMNEYHSRAHSETKRPPLERWAAAAFLPRLPASLQQLDLLLLTLARSRKVQRDGVRFQGYRYFDCILAGFVGEEVSIRFDPRDLGEIFVYSDNQMICKATCAELSGKVISLKDIVRTRIERKKALKALLLEKSDAVQKFVDKPRSPRRAIRPNTAESVSKPKIKRYANE